MHTIPMGCVLLANRHHALSEGIRGLLSTVSASVVMVADADSLLESATRLHPDMAVVDLSLGTSLDWLAALRHRCPDLAIVALGVHDEPGVRDLVLGAGADALVMKHSLATGLLPAIAAVQAAHRAEPPPEH